MTPREFRLAVEGRSKKRDRDMEMLAFHAAWIINHRTPAFGEKRRKPVTPAQLLGKKEEPSIEQSAARWREFLRVFQKPKARGA